MEIQGEEESRQVLLRLEQIGTQILSASRNELYLGMRFLDVALSNFVFQMDSSVSPYGTDGAVIYFHPRFLGGLYRQNRILVNRGYLHMVLHCIFRHMMRSGMDALYWNLSCDIAVEYIIDGIYHRSVRFSRSLLRRELYRELEASGKVQNAEWVYARLYKRGIEEKQLERLREEFYSDDHCYWENQNPNQKPNPNLQQKWQDISEQMETDLETFSKEASEKTGTFLEQMKVANRDKIEYRQFLRKFAVFWEEIGIDLDTFDYSFYSYGLRLYGNMPLIEPQETKEVKKISEFVIVIDTSMSCSGDLVKRFLEETYAVLRQENSFFQKVNIHIIQCDEKVHSDEIITNINELKQYMETLSLYGNGGTDFRPAFSYVQQLLEKGEWKDLRGLLYFTDGYGTYPQKKPPYKTAFVFLEEEYTDVDVPAWAIKVILREQDLEDRDGYQ